jgi:S1-C subfamily serine protease
MDENSGTEPSEAERRETTASGAGSQPPSTPPGWVPPWNAPAGSHGQPGIAPPPPTGAGPFPPPTAYGPGTQFSGSPYSGGPYVTGPAPGGPYGGGPYGGGPYGGGPYGSGWRPGPPSTPPRPISRGLVVTIVAVAVLVAALVGGLVGHGLSISSGNGLSLGGGGSSPTSPPSGAPSNASSIAAAVDPGLVDINTVISSEGVEGAGTGMVLTSTGEILTNNHVVEGETSISVTDVGNGKTYGATVVGYDRTQDVAVVQLTGASGLQTVPIGDSSTVAVGNGVVAVGNAGGTGGTPTYAAGTIVATDQTISATDEVNNSSEQLTGLLETDANIQEGDSGGPLVGAAGKVIGMDTAASNGFQFANSGTQGYAIPINTALTIAREIEAGAASSTVHVGPTAFLGVGVVNVSSGCGGAFGGGGSGSGAEICQLVSGGPAAQVGMQIGDVITGVAGQTVTSATSLTDVMITQKPGATVAVRYLDTSGQEHTVNVTLSTGAPQ